MKLKCLYSFFAVLLFIAGCSPSDAQNLSTQTATTENFVAESTDIPDTFFAWDPPYLPQSYLAELHWPQNVKSVTTLSEADLWLDVGADNVVSRWVYALAAPFPTVIDEISLIALQGFWRGDEIVDFPANRLLVDGSTKLLFEKLWGSASAQNVVQVASSQLLTKAWTELGSWVLLPFEDLEPRWKVIAVDGQSPIRKGFDPQRFPLTIPFSLNGDLDMLAAFTAALGASGYSDFAPVTNYDSEKLTTVLLTGVTALVRGTAFLMERNGMTYPALDIGDILRAADITHISNEIPFTESCPNPFLDTVSESMLVFCSKPEYITLLEAVGTDVVELTGDHFRDWGADAMLTTIGMYEQRGWGYYGGGKDLADGQKPLLLEHNSNKIAFLGCNAKPAGYATATVDQPGAVHCDLQVMAEKIAEVRNQGYLPIVTFQHLEYYSYNANPYLVQDFHAVVDAGAAIVSGSQAHQPHAFEFYRGAFLHYGLGNLFFDQHGEGFAQRQAFLDRYVIYAGRHISTELETMIFVDMARPRLMDAQERDYLLRDVFFASGW